MPPTSIEPVADSDQEVTPEQQYRGKSLTLTELVVGDGIYDSEGKGLGHIIRIGPKNFTTKVEVRFRPEGPWFVQEHKVLKTSVTYVARGSVTHPIQGCPTPTSYVACKVAKAIRVLPAAP